MDPWAEHPLAEDWPFAVHMALATGEVVSEENAPFLPVFFDLPEGRPEGKPFPHG